MEASSREAPTRERRFKVTIQGRELPIVDMADITLGEQETIERGLGIRFDEEGNIVGASGSGYTIAVVLVAWQRAEPRIATPARVRALRLSEYDVEELEPEDGEASPPEGAGGSAEATSLSEPEPPGGPS